MRGKDGSFLVINEFLFRSSGSDWLYLFRNRHTMPILSMTALHCFIVVLRLLGYDPRQRPKQILREE